MLRILVIDDDEDMLTMVRLILKENYYTVKTVTDVEKIFSIQHNFQPHLIIIEMHLNHEDGLSLCKELKFINKGHNVPILMYSQDKDLKNSYLGSGAEDYMIKPFTTNQLLDRINLIFSKSKYYFTPN